MIISRESLEQREKRILAPYACFSADSQGRNHPEENDLFRTCFQRDRDRIIHSKAFRRLRGKTQVFIAYQGDHFRSRLTHTMEVAQVSRDMARTLGMNEDLAESIALAHDLGHTPFGHAGEEALSEKMQAFGESFEHNKQSIRIVTELEKRSEHFSGLNLSKEVIEGLGKHEITEGFESGALPSLEAQIVNIADEIAYLHHDIDDGIRSGILDIRELKSLAIWKKVQDQEKDIEVYLSRSLGKLISMMIHDVYEETERRIEENSIQKNSDVRNCKKRIVAFSSHMFQDIQELRKFLFERFYKEKEVQKMNAYGKNIIHQLFDFYMQHPQEIPEEYRIRLNKKNLHHTVRDYIAGMTDSFAEEITHGKVIHPLKGKL